MDSPFGFAGQVALSLVVRALFCWSETAVVGAEVQWDWDYILSGRAAGRVCPLRQPHRVVREPKRVKKGLSVQRWQRSRFCLAPTGGGFGDRLTQAMRYGCVPLIIQPNVTQPLEDILPYETFSLRVGLDDVPRLPEILGAVSRSQHASLLRGVRNFSPLFNWHTTHGQAFDAVAYTAAVSPRQSPPACGHLAPLALLVRWS